MRRRGSGIRGLRRRGSGIRGLRRGRVVYRESVVDGGGRVARRAEGASAPQQQRARVLAAPLGGLDLGRRCAVLDERWLGRGGAGARRLDPRALERRRALRRRVGRVGVRDGHPDPHVVPLGALAPDARARDGAVVVHAHGARVELALAVNLGGCPPERGVERDPLRIGVGGRMDGRRKGGSAFVVNKSARGR